MGITPFWRNLLRLLCRKAFYPNPGARWPLNPNRPISAYISDINSLIRKKQLAVSSNGIRLDYGFKTWGDLTSWLGRDYNKLFAEGVTQLYVVFDGKTPENKAVEQQDRKQSWQNGFDRANATREESEPELKPYVWPREDDDKPWFDKSKQVFCSFNDIYYGGALSKRKFYEFICHYLLYEMPLPPTCQVIIDCGALHGRGMLRRPVRARIQHICDPGADRATIVQSLACATEAGIENSLKRIVEDVPGEEPYNTWTEADDRLIYWVYKITLDAQNPRNVIIGSEDGDAMLALMATFPTRRVLRPANQPPGRVYLRRTQIIGYLVNERGVKNKVDQPEWIDTDCIAEYLDDAFGGLLCADVRNQDDYTSRERCDPVIFYCMMALMCENDYVEGLKGLTAVNILRGMIERPDLARESLFVRRPIRSNGKRPALDESAQPESCLVNAESARKFIKFCYSVAHQNRVSPKLYPVPSDEFLDSVLARMSWTLDKTVNAGRPGYQLEHPFLSSPDTMLPVHGYEYREVRDEETGRVKKRPKFASRVDRRQFYGVAHKDPVVSSK